MLTTCTFISSFSVTVTPGNGLMTAAADGVNIQQWITRQLTMLTRQGKRALGRVISRTVTSEFILSGITGILKHLAKWWMHQDKHVRIDKSACWYCWSDPYLSRFKEKCNFTLNVHLPWCIPVPCTCMLLKFYKSIANNDGRQLLFLSFITVQVFLDNDIAFLNIYIGFKQAGGDTLLTLTPWYR